MGRPRCALIALSAAAAFAAAPAFAAPIQFTVIADSAHPGFLPPLSFFGGENPGRTLALNDQGQVAFYAGWAGIYRGDGDTLTPMARVSDGFEAWVAYGFRGNVGINNGGSVTFLGGGRIETSDPYGLWVSDGTTHTLRVDGGSALTGAQWGWTALSDAGDLAFGRRGDGRSAAGVFLDLHAGGQLLLAAEGGELPGGFTRTRFRAASDSGQVAFFGEDPLVAPGRYGIYRADASGVTPIARLSDGFARFSPMHSSGVDTARGQTLGIDEGGTVAFWAERADGTTGLFAGDGTTLRTLVDDADGFSGFEHWRDGSHTVLLSDLGDFAFLAERADGYRGIFFGSGGEIVPVIGLGDAIFGSTVTELVLSHAGLNNAQQVAFIATLASGREVVVRATIPEPVSALGLLLAALWIRRRG